MRIGWLNILQKSKLAFEKKLILINSLIDQIENELIPREFFAPIHKKRFFSNIVKGKTKKDCWKWIGCKNTGGYGIFSVLRLNISSHRYSYVLHGSIINPNEHVLHKCDNPECSNPIHLYSGIQKDNTNDMILRGRTIYRKDNLCQRGHALDGINSRGFRYCKSCNRLASKKWYWEIRKASFENLSK